MPRVSQQAGISIHQRDSRVSSLPKFTIFWQSFYTRPKKSSEKFIKPEWIPAELSLSSYSEYSQQAGKSYGPQNQTSLSTLQEWTWEHYRGLNLTFFTLSTGKSRRVFIGGLSRCLRQSLGSGGPLVRLAIHLTWLGSQALWQHRLSHIGYPSCRLNLTHVEDGFWKDAKPWPTN
jgi:hypothetical protein